MMMRNTSKYVLRARLITPTYVIYIPGMIRARGITSSYLLILVLFALSDPSL